MKNVARIYTIFLALFLTLHSVAYAQTVTIDGWNVSYLGKTYVGNDTKFSYRACSQAGQGPLRRFTIGVPDCFPVFTVVDSSPSTSLEPNWDDSNGVYGVLFNNLNLASGCKDFSYTVLGTVKDSDVGQVTIGVTDDDSGSNCSKSCGCGSGGLLPGPKCIIGTGQGGGACGPYVYGDVVIMQDGSRCVTPADPANQPDTRRDAEKTACTDFVNAVAPLDLRPRVGIASHNWGNSLTCNTQTIITDPNDPWARFSSLDDGAGGLDFDGYLHQDFVPNTYNAISKGINWTCGDTPLDAAITVAQNHMTSPWGDNQSPNYMILISHGRTNRWSSAGGGACNAANSCNCATAKNYALTAANQAKAQGTTIFTVFLDDTTCGCSAADTTAGKNFLRDQIATNASDYFEATTATLPSVLDQIRAKLTGVVSCPAGKVCDNGCCMAPTPTPTPTKSPTPTKTPTPTPTSTPTAFSCSIANSGGTIAVSSDCNTTSTSVTVSAQVTGSGTSGLVKSWTSTCPGAQITVMSNDTAKVTFTTNPQSPTACDVSYTLTKGGTSNSCGSHIIVTPTCGLNCHSTSIADIQLAIDSQASNINKMVKQAGSILTSVAKTQSSKTKKSLLTTVSKNLVTGQSLFDLIWTSIWTKISSSITTCEPACTTVSLLAQKTSIQASSNQQVAVANKLLKTIFKFTHNRTLVAKAKTVQKKLKAYAQKETKAISSIPDASQKC